MTSTAPATAAASSCGVVVTDVAVYCPECGTRLPKAARRRGAAG